jgi:hypothetical protein
MLTKRAEAARPKSFTVQVNGTLTVSTVDGDPICSGCCATLCAALHESGSDDWPSIVKYSSCSPKSIGIRNGPATRCEIS